MGRKKFLLGTTLFLLGFTGILTLLTLKIELPKEAMELLLEQFTPTQIQLLLLANPTFMLLIAVLLGTLTFQKAQLQLPVFEKLFRLSDHTPNYKLILFYGFTYGLVAGLAIVGVAKLFEPSISNELSQLAQKIEPTLSNRFLYGGITEELLMRFGLMGVLTWVLVQVTQSHKNWIYWTSISLSSFVFAIGHLPAVFQTLGTPSVLLFCYILIGNIVGGMIFGWLYWKRGLSSAIVAHMSAHLAMISLESIL